jgi:PTS system beta-glucosides-specific IIC component
MNYQDTARQIIDRIGGKENVLSLFHCITRLRFLLKDNDKADRAALEALDGVMGVNISGDQFQLIIGNDVEPLCKALLAVLPISTMPLAPPNGVTRFRWYWKACRVFFRRLFRPLPGPVF